MPLCLTRIIFLLIFLQLIEADSISNLRISIGLKRRFEAHIQFCLCPSTLNCPCYTLPVSDCSADMFSYNNSDISFLLETKLHPRLLLGKMESTNNSVPEVGLKAFNLLVSESKGANGEQIKEYLLEIEAERARVVVAFPTAATCQKNTIVIFYTAYLVSHRFFWNGFGLIYGPSKHNSKKQGKKAEMFSLMRNAFPQQFDRILKPDLRRTEELSFSFNYQYNDPAEPPVLFALEFDLGQTEIELGEFVQIDLEKLNGVFSQIGGKKKIVFVYGFYESYILESISEPQNSKKSFGIKELSLKFEKLLFDRISINNSKRILELTLWKNSREKTFESSKSAIENYQASWFFNTYFAKLEPEFYESVKFLSCSTNLENSERFSFYSPVNWYIYSSFLFLNIDSFDKSGLTICKDESTGFNYIAKLLLEEEEPISFDE